MAHVQSDLESARQRLCEAAARLREQAELIERLASEGKTTEEALDLLKAIGATIEEMQTHIQFLAETDGREE